MYRTILISQLDLVENRLNYYEEREKTDLQKSIYVSINITQFKRKLESLSTLLAKNTIFEIHADEKNKLIEYLLNNKFSFKDSPTCNYYYPEFIRFYTKQNVEIQLYDNTVEIIYTDKKEDKPIYSQEINIQQIVDEIMNNTIDIHLKPFQIS